MKKKIVAIIFLSLIILSFVFIRQYKYFDLLTCEQDQGVHFIETWKIYAFKKLTLIGVASDLKVDGREFYSGPAVHYLTLPFLLIFGWEQRSVSYLMMVFGLSASLFVFWILSSKYKKKRAAYIFLILYSLSPLTVHTDRLFWAPSFMFPISTFIIGFLLYLMKPCKHPQLALFVIGFFMGLGLQIHYPFVFAIAVSLIWLRVINKINLNNLSMIIVGFVLGFSPIIVFELKHQFYNTFTVLKMVYKNNDLIKFSITRNFYYFSTMEFSSDHAGFNVF